MIPTPEQYMTQRMDAVAKEIEAIESLAEQTFLFKVAEYSEQIPNMTVEVVGGNGALYVTAYDASNTARHYHRHSDPRPDDPETYKFLFGWMEELEEKLGNYYANFPMVCPGIVLYKNGQKI